MDRCIKEGQIGRWRYLGRWGDIHRLEDISHDEGDHDRFWAVHLRENRNIEDEEFVTAVRLRLSCGGSGEPSACDNCGNRSMPAGGYHGILFAFGESVRGYNNMSVTSYTTLRA